MEKFNFLSRVLLTVFAGAVFTPFSSFADRNTALLAQEDRRNMTKVQGTLTCKLPEVNDGSACEIRFRDANSGQTYTLRNVSRALDLFYQGKKQVEIRGQKLLSENTIRIATVKAL